MTFPVQPYKFFAVAYFLISSKHFFNVTTLVNEKHTSYKTISFVVHHQRMTSWLVFKYESKRVA